MTSRLTNKVRDEAVDEIVSTAFDSQWRKLAEDLDSVYEAAYTAQYGKFLESQGLGPETLSWLPKQQRFCLQMSSSKAKVVFWEWHRDDEYREKRLRQLNGRELKSPRPVPANASCYLVLKSKRLQNKVTKLLVRAHKLVEEEVSIHDEVCSILYSCATRKKLLEHWPEAEKFLPPEIGTTNLPMLPVTGINKKLEAAGAL